MAFLKKKKANRYNSPDVNDDGSIEDYTAGFDYDDTYQDDSYQDDSYQDDPFDGGGQPQPSKSKNKKKFDASALLLVLGGIIVIGLLYVGVSAVIGPRVGESKEVIAELQGGINELNPDRFVNVLEPKTRRIIQVIFIAVESMTDIDLTNAFSQALNTLCVGFLPSDTNEPVTDLLKKVEIVPVNFGLPGRTRKVKCKVKFDDVTYQYIRVTLQKYEGETYINKIELIDK